MYIVTATLTVLLSVSDIKCIEGFMLHVTHTHTHTHTLPVRSLDSFLNPYLRRIVAVWKFSLGDWSL